MSTQDRDPTVDCSILTALNILSRKWMLFILTELIIDNEKRLGKGMYFSDLLTNVKDKYGTKISPRVLSDCLQHLEAEKVINREVLTDSMPVRVSYSLTEKGEDFLVVLSALKGWGIKYGGVKQKVCQNFSCLHNAVPIMNIDKALDIITVNPNSTDENDVILHKE